MAQWLRKHDGPRRAARWIAILEVGVALLLRASDLARSHMPRNEAGTNRGKGLVIRLDRDKAGHAVQLAVPEKFGELRPARALRHWLRHAARAQSGSDEMGRGLFGVTAATISAQVRKLATAVGVPDPDRYAGHSLRRGGATYLAATGAEDSAIMEAGRWKSLAVMRGYVHGATRDAIKRALRRAHTR